MPLMDKLKVVKSGDLAFGSKMTQANKKKTCLFGIVMVKNVMGALVDYGVTNTPLFIVKYLIKVFDLYKLQFED